MLVGALADAGADQDALTSGLESLATGARFRFEKVKRWNGRLREASRTQSHFVGLCGVQKPAEHGVLRNFLKGHVLL